MKKTGADPKNCHEPQPISKSEGSLLNIAIDCRMFNASGVGVYLRGCLPYFLQTEHHFLLLGNIEHLRSFETCVNVNIINCNIKPFSLKELFFFPSGIKKQINKADIYYSPFFNIPRGIKIPVYTTIHDIIFPDMPQLVSRSGLYARMFFFRRAYKKSRKIFTVSEFSKSRIEYHLGAGKPVIVTHSAIQQIFLDYREKVKNIKEKETIVFIGNIKKHKGLDYFIDAFSLAKKEGLNHKLVIIGSKEHFRSEDNSILQKIESLGQQAVSFTGFVTDEKLIENLAESSLLVQPSLYEGFCLPPLEAMSLGTKALISDIPVLKEIYSKYPVTYFEAGNILDLKNKLMEILYKKEAPVITLTENLINNYTFKKSSLIILDNLN